MGAVVVPLCIVLMVGMPYQILVDRDFALNSRAVTATAIESDDVRTKQGWVQNYKFRYVVDGTEYSTWLGAPKDVSVGHATQLVYAPRFPWHARLPAAPERSWDDDMWSRLAISYALALVFGGVWLTGLAAARRAARTQILRAGV